MRIKHPVPARLRAKSIARLKETRAALGLSREDYAALFGSSPSTVDRWLSFNDDANPPTRALMLFCMKSDYSPTWILFGSGSQLMTDIDDNYRRIKTSIQLREAMASVERIHALTAEIEKKLTPS